MKKKTLLFYIIILGFGTNLLIGQTMNYKISPDTGKVHSLEKVKFKFTEIKLWDEDLEETRENFHDVSSIFVFNLDEYGKGKVVTLVNEEKRIYNIEYCYKQKYSNTSNQYLLFTTDLNSKIAISLNSQGDIVSIWIKAEGVNERLTFY